jgi:hypothetical protein
MEHRPERWNLSSLLMTRRRTSTRCRKALRRSSEQRAAAKAAAKGRSEGGSKGRSEGGSKGRSEGGSKPQGGQDTRAPGCSAQRVSMGPITSGAHTVPPHRVSSGARCGPDLTKSDGEVIPPPHTLHTCLCTVSWCLKRGFLDHPLCLTSPFIYTHSRGRFTQSPRVVNISLVIGSTFPAGVPTLRFLLISHNRSHLPTPLSVPPSVPIRTSRCPPCLLRVCM